MKEKPILFSSPMVRAIIDGRKTQTRRVVKPPKWRASFSDGRPLDYMLTDLSKATRDHGFPTDERGELLPMEQWKSAQESQYKNHYLHVPFAHPNDGWQDGYARDRHYAPWASGERLWVKEAWGYFGGDEYLYQQDRASVGYRADHTGVDPVPGERWRSSLFMPRWASRITLEVKAVRVERLQAISEADAVTEGLPVQMGDGTGPGPGFKWKGPGYCDCVSRNEWGPTFHVPRDGGFCHCNSCEGNLTPARGAFKMLWDSINGNKHPWASNPWVWVIEFERV